MGPAGGMTLKHGGYGQKQGTVLQVFFPGRRDKLYHSRVFINTLTEFYRNGSDTIGKMIAKTIERESYA